MKFSNDPADELQRYMDELVSEDLPWYLRVSRHHYGWWLGLQFVAMFCSALSGLIAALMGEYQFDAIGRIIIVFLSFLGTLAVSWLATFRHRQMEDLRERGYLRLRHALNEARADFTIANQPEQFLAIHKKLRDFVDQLDLQQHTEVHSILGTKNGATAAEEA